MVGDEGRPFRSAIGGLALAAVIAVPGGIALLGLSRVDRRILTPAIVAGLVPTAVALLSVGLALLVGILLWVQAALRWPGPRETGAWRRDLWPLAVPVLTILAGLALFVHPDPQCWSWVDDGDGGWIYTRQAPATGPAGAARIESGAEVTGARAGRTCTSNALTPAESAISLLCSAGALAVAWGTARPGPRETLSVPSGRTGSP